MLRSRRIIQKRPYDRLQCTLPVRNELRRMWWNLAKVDDGANSYRFIRQVPPHPPELVPDGQGALQPVVGTFLSRVMNQSRTSVRSVDDCARIGKASGRRYFGLENGSECYVADSSAIVNGPNGGPALIHNPGRVIEYATQGDVIATGSRG
jgi:hypothetical protein